MYLANEIDEISDKASQLRTILVNFSALENYYLFGTNYISSYSVISSFALLVSLRSTPH